MSLRLMLILSGLLAGCATGRDAAAPTCDGRDRRPANPYGSILLPTSPPSQTGAEPTAGEPSGVAEEAPVAGGCA
ncbi:MAG TPA: hypothetical protein DCG66_11555 [Brevundimonas sp.]|jgi:hypothetical protein|uniref:hypothetical protein n=1 Tax=uncultured Brevundimonas sp. TaxID=213418 RepID=UPI000C948AF6|nr:hypothetical protein [Brevundimonas sp.]HAF81634.1 hypothetical protein [Brevundimonas sp.]